VPDKLWIDIETRSRVDLKKCGVYRYVRCPDFKILMASWSLDGSPIRTALNYDEIYEIPGLWDGDVAKVAHNAAFERVCFSEFISRSGLGWGDRQYLAPETYHDTQAVAGELGYPQKLEKLAPALGAEEKDTAGTRLINLFCKPNRKGGWNDHTTHPMEWLDFIAYCEQDVSTLMDVDRLLGDFPTEGERAAYLADQRINDRGLRIDVPLAREAIRIGAVNTAKQVARVQQISGILNPGSVQQLGAWLEETGHPLPNLRAETVETALRGDVPPDVREVLELRQELALAAPAKFTSALASEVDGRLCGTLRFFGAHTGRWAGRGPQPHNLPRLAFTKLADGKEVWDEVAEQEAILTAMMGGIISAEELKKLVRPLFVGPFTVVDYASIEARVIAWLAGEEWTLQAARDGRDLYVETAERMGGLTRAQGKIAVLALGFGGSIGSLRVMGATGSDDELYSLVHAWRDANPNIVRFWERMELAFRTGGIVGGLLAIEKHGNDRLVRLPSGRAICYRKGGMTFDDLGRPRLNFWSPQGRRVETYGGRLAENATQAVARDLLAGALVRLEQRGYPVVGHVHDEILVEGEHDVDMITKIMCEPPDWAAGLPIDGEGFQCARYRKG
jgi:DNA polymerase